MKQNKKQKSFGNSLSVDNLDYPIIVTLPKNYWNFSKNSDLEIEYILDD